MDRITNIIIVGIILIVFAELEADILDNVGQAQLDIAYNCYIEYSEIEFSKYCRNELDGFGHYVDLSGSIWHFAALESI